MPITEEVAAQDLGVGLQPLVKDNGLLGSSTAEVVLGILVVLRVVVSLALALLVLLLLCKIMF